MSRRTAPAVVTVIAPCRPRLRELSAEAVAGLVQRPARTVLTMLGTVLGVGAFVAILGLTSTAGGQVSAAFTVLSATQVSVDDVGDSATEQALAATGRYDFPADADAIAERLHGVVHAGVWWQVTGPSASALAVTAVPTAASSGGSSGAPMVTVYAADPEALAAMDPTVTVGTTFNAFHDSRREHVIMLSAPVAAQLGVSRLDAQPAVFLDDVAYTVVGVYTRVARQPEVLLGAVIPAGTARADFGPPSPTSPATMLVQTRLGAAPQTAADIATALRPDRPALFRVVPPPDPHSLKDDVLGSLNALFLLLAGVTLVIGAVGIANTTLVSVLERSGEIGLRRALGARPRHIAFQFLAESTVIGALGGLIGTALGIGVTVAVALVRHWTAVLDPALVLPAPAIGAVVGLLAGTYPALRAAAVEPVEALRR
ncbi:ABC transporter permease [Catenulispora subtropica]|uniref:ABC transporter permease n=1 Tax=Catenulispora subtropica TaxID=450798 RepID=A0ABN2S9N4_9ACTN